MNNAGDTFILKELSLNYFFFICRRNIVTNSKHNEKLNKGLFHVAN